MNKKQFTQYIKEIIISEVTMVGAKTDLNNAANIAKTERTGIDVVKLLSARLKNNMPVGVAECH